MLGQEMMIDVLLKGHGLESANGVRSPIDEDCNEVDPKATYILGTSAVFGHASVKAFQLLIGNLLWIARCTRPDISFAVHRATRQTHSPIMKDWKMVKRIAMYIKGTKTLKLFIGSTVKSMDPIQILSWSDADFAADKSDRKSVSGCVLTMDGAVVSWACKKQTGVSLSTIGAELIAASQAGCELLGLNELFGELDIKFVEPMPMGMDNQAAIKQLDSEKSTSSAKHVDICFKFICHYAQVKTVKTSYVKSGEIIADLWTKALPAPWIVDLRNMFKLKAIQDDVDIGC